MIETGLIIAQAVFVLLLYLFVWSVVRSSSRQIGAEQPRALPREPGRVWPRRRREPDRRREAVAARPPPPPPPPPPAPPPPAPLEPPVAARDENTAESLEDEGSPQPEPAHRDRSRPAEGGFDLSANIHPKLVVEHSPDLPPGSEIDLDGGGLTIGRSPSSGLEIGDAFVSHMHARIMRRGPFLFVQDLGSTNGTFLNDRRIDGDAQLKMRDQLRIGETVLRYEE